MKSEVALLLLLLSHFSRVRLCATPWTAAHQLPRPWDSPGKNTGVGCHFLLQCMKVKSGREVAQSYPTLRDPMDCSPPGSSVHGVFQARVLEWVAISFCRDLPKPGIEPGFPTLQADSLPSEPPQTYLVKIQQQKYTASAFRQRAQSSVCLCEACGGGSTGRDEVCVQ